MSSLYSPPSYESLAFWLFFFLINFLRNVLKAKGLTTCLLRIYLHDLFQIKFKIYRPAIMTKIIHIFFLKVWLWYETETLINMLLLKTILNVGIFFIFVDAIKSFLPIKYNLVLRPNYRLHQSLLFVKRHGFCKLGLHTMPGTWDVRRAKVCVQLENSLS